MQLTAYRAVITADLFKVLREPFFWFILAAPLLLGLALGELLPWLDQRFAALQLNRYFPVAVALIILTPPLYYGVVLALQILQEKDENALLAVNVTPATLGWFVGVRIGVYTLISIPMIVIVHGLIGVIEVPGWKLAWVAAAASLNTPLIALLIPAFARNLLDGMVIGKGLGFVVLFPLAMFWVPDYWHLLCGILPTYWPIIAYYTAIDPAASSAFFGLAIGLSLVIQPLASVWLYRRFERRLLVG